MPGTIFPQFPVIGLLSLNCWDRFGYIVFDLFEQKGVAFKYFLHSKSFDNINEFLCFMYMTYVFEISVLSKTL